MNQIVKKTNRIKNTIDLKGGVYMTKNDILLQLNSAKWQLDNYRSQKRTIDEKYNTICEFSRECTSHVNSFGNSIAKRKKKLLKIEGLLQCVKIASQYKKKMNDMLTGTSYANVSKNIGELESVISAEKRKLTSELQYVEQQIRNCETKVSNLQYTYNHYKEESGSDGK